MKNTNNNNNNNSSILNSFLNNDLSSIVEKNFHIFDKYINSTFIKKLEIIRDRDLNLLTELPKYFKELYLINIEINCLHDLFSKYNHLNEENEVNIDLLKLINSEIFVRTFKFDKNLKKLVELCATLKWIFWWDIEIESEDRYSNLFFIVNILKRLDFDFNNFNLTLKTEDFATNIKLRNRINDIYFAKIENPNISIDKIKENFTLPIVDIDPANLSLTDNLILDLNNGWYKKFNSNTKKLERNNEKDGLFLINLNIIFKHDNNGNIMNNQLVYSQYRYNKIFTQPLISYIEEVHKLNAKFARMNSTIYVLVDDFKNYSHWENSEGALKVFFENFENIYKNRKTTLNPVQFLLATSIFGPLYIKEEYMTNLIKLLFKGDIIKILNIYFQILKDYNNPIFEVDGIDKNLNLKLANKFNSNLINKFIFVVKDKENFIKNLEMLKINGGPLNYRHEGNSLQNKLCRIDESFRKSFGLSLSPYFNNLGLKYNDFTS